MTFKNVCYLLSVPPVENKLHEGGDFYIFLFTTVSPGPKTATGT